MQFAVVSRTIFVSVLVFFTRTESVMIWAILKKELAFHTDECFLPESNWAKKLTKNSGLMGFL